MEEALATHSRPRLRRLTVVALVAAVHLGSMAVPAAVAGSKRVSASSSIGACAGPLGHAAREAEPSIAVNPTDPRHVAVAWIQGADLAVVVAISRSGGATWSRAVVPGLTVCSGGDFERVAHPRLAFSPDGQTLYVSSFARDDQGPSGTVTRIFVSRSDDGGHHWRPPSQPGVAGHDVTNDFATLVVEPDTGAVDVVWSPAELAVTSEPVLLSRSTDRGETWTQTPIRVAAPGTNAWDRIVALPDGTLLDVYQNAPLQSFVTGEPMNASIAAIVSTDKGASWSDPVALGDGAGFQWPTATVGPSGDVYVAWVAAAEGGTCGREFTASDGGACRVVVSRSDGRGVSWTPPATAASWNGPWMPMPGLAASGDGTVGVIHTTSARDLAGGVVGSVGISRSNDAAVSWMTETIEEPFTLDRIRAAGGLGLYQQLAALPNGFAAAFVLGAPVAVDGDSDIYFGRFNAN